MALFVARHDGRGGHGYGRAPKECATEFVAAVVCQHTTIGITQ
jgi:hypothetical protein